MRRTRVCLTLLMATCLVFFFGVRGPGGHGVQADGTGQAAKRASGSQSAKAVTPDLTREPTLFVVGYAHLDTEWRWDYPTTIREYLPKTMRDNFALFEKYPHYVFNFSGANRYRMMKEYYPADYER